MTQVHAHAHVTFRGQGIKAEKAITIEMLSCTAFTAFTAAHLKPKTAQNHIIIKRKQKKLANIKNEEK